MRLHRACVCLLLLCASRAGAQSASPLTQLRVGTRVRIDAPGIVPDHFVGTLLLPATDSLLLADEHGPPVTVRPSQLTSVEVSRGKSAYQGGVRGLLIGAPIGFAVGLLFSKGKEVQVCSLNGCEPQENRWQDIQAMTLGGAGIGLVSGMMIGRERWTHLPLAEVRVGRRPGASAERRLQLSLATPRPAAAPAR